MQIISRHVIHTLLILIRHKNLDFPTNTRSLHSQVQYCYIQVKAQDSVNQFHLEAMHGKNHLRVFKQGMTIIVQVHSNQYQIHWANDIHNGLIDQNVDEAFVGEVRIPFSIRFKLIFINHKLIFVYKVPSDVMQVTRNRRILVYDDVLYSYLNKLNLPTNNY